MSFPRYQAYKPSGVEWLGEVPEHWDEKPLKTVASINDEVLPESLSADYEIEYVDIGSVSLMNGIEKTETLLFAEAPSRARRIPRDGDVLVSTVRTYLKAIAPVVSPQANLVASTGFAVVRPLTDLHPGYLKYALQEEHFIHQVISRSTGVSYPAINASDVAKILLCLPVSSEQQKIAAFLDRETAKIDALIAEQQRLIELLQEKRQAVISHAVTKGLNPNAPMKDSGVEWLGEVPEHWEIKAVKHLCSLLRDGTHLPPPREATGIPLLSVRNIQEDQFALRDDDSFISEDSYDELCRSFSPQPGDTLLAIVGATMGKTAIVPSDIGKFHIQRSLGIFRIKKEMLHPEWLNFVFRSSQFTGLLWRDVAFSAQPGIYLGALKDVPIPVPPPPEQSEILKTSNRKLQDLNLLVAAAQHAVSLHHERRSALISAVVTGQIDVRGLVEAEGGE
jgi:type I restriction enzyme, S subunit